MSEKKDNGGCAFPYVPHTPNSEYVFEYDSGMSLRDWFAGMAMMGLRSNPRDDISNTTRNDMAVEAYRQADAMLEVREL